MAIRSYVITDSFDGRVLQRLHKASSRSTAKRLARKYSDETYPDRISLIEIGRMGSRTLIQQFERAA